MIPAVQNFINYLTPTNTDRIANLSPHDPFAIFGFILLVLIVPISLILLTVVARRSVYSIMGRFRHEGIYRKLRRKPKRREQRVVAPLLPTRRSEGVVGSGGGRVTSEGMDEMQEEGGEGKSKRVSFADAASSHVVPEQQQQRAPLPFLVTQDPHTSAKKRVKKANQSRLPSAPTSDATLPIKPIQRPLSPCESPYVPESTAVAAKPQPPLTSQPAPTKLPPSKPTKRPPYLSPTSPISKKPASAPIQPRSASQPTPKKPSRSPIKPTFEELYDQWEAARRAPQIDLVVEEDPGAKREWLLELHAEIRGA